MTAEEQPEPLTPPTTQATTVQPIRHTGGGIGWAIVLLLLALICVAIVGFSANYSKAEQTRQEEQDARFGETVTKLQEDHQKCEAFQQLAQQDPAHHAPYNPKACG